MEEMGEIREAVLQKARQEAEQAVKSAEAEALKEIQNAEKQLEARFLEEKTRVIDDAKREAARTLAGASVEAHLSLSKIKADIVQRVVDQVKGEIDKAPASEASLHRLTKEAIDGLGAPKVRLLASNKDVATLQKLVNGDRELADKVAEVKEVKIAGGVIAEGIDGKLRVDNSYGTRLDMLLPQILPEMERELFAGD